MPIKTKQFYYRNAVTWTEGHQCVSTSDPTKPSFKLSPPPEFGGPPGYWTPEELFVASLNGCLMTTLLAIAAREGLEIVAYECSAEGILESKDGPWSFSRVIMRPSLTLAADEDPALARSVLRIAERSCPISNSVWPEIEIKPDIKLEKFP